MHKAGVEGCVIHGMFLFFPALQTEDWVALQYKCCTSEDTVEQLEGRKMEEFVVSGGGEGHD